MFLPHPSPGRDGDFLVFWRMAALPSAGNLRESAKSYNIAGYDSIHQNSVELVGNLLIFEFSSLNGLIVPHMLARRPIHPERRQLYSDDRWILPQRRALTCLIAIGDIVHDLEG